MNKTQLIDVIAESRTVQNQAKAALESLWLHY